MAGAPAMDALATVLHPRLVFGVRLQNDALDTLLGRGVTDRQPWASAQTERVKASTIRAARWVGVFERFEVGRTLLSA